MATDDCGNAASGIQHIYQIADTTNTAVQLVGVPAHADASCDQIPGPPVVEAITSCQDSFVNVTYYEIGDPNQTGCFQTIERVWIAYDNCGNTDTATQFIYVSDYEFPILVDVPSDISILCTDPIPDPFTVYAYDNCSEPVIDVFDQSFGTPCDPTTTNYILRTWVATDDCGNAASGIQHIYQIQDTTSTAVQLIGVPEDMDAFCDQIPNLPTVTAITSCQDSFVNIVYSEISDPGGCNYMIQRTWIANDNCGNTDSISQLIYVIDIESPTLLDVPSDISISCTDPIPDPYPVTAIDNCGVVNVTTYDQAFGIPCDPTTTNYILRTWTVSDECGNTAEETQQIFLIDSVQNSTVTFLSVPTDITVSCDAFPGMPVVEAVTTCQDSFVNIFVNDIRTDGPCPESYTITRVWEATDNCGAVNTASQTIIVEDITEPVLLDIPDTITVLCSEVPAPATPLAVDNCDTDVEIIFTEVQIGSPCTEGSALLRTWTATDDCGNSTTADQMIYTLPDPSEIYLTGVPADELVQCDQIILPPNPGQVGAYTSCLDSLVDISFDEVYITGSCPGSYIIERTWIAFDYCGNADTAVQTIIVEDTQAPVFEVMSDVHLECGEDPSGVPPLPVLDNCDTDVDLTYTEEEFGVICEPGYYVLRTYTLVDNCGNQATGTQIITVQADTIPPCEDPLLSIIATEANCGAADGSVYLELINDPIAYSYIWSPNVSIEHFATNLSPGLYTVEILSNIDPNCVFVHTVAVGNTDFVSATIDYITPAGCDGYNGGASLSPSTYEYFWSDGMIGNVRQDLAVGTYYVTTTDASATCSDVMIVNIDYDSSSFEVLPYVLQEPTCGNANGSVVLEMVGGSGNYSFSWGAGDTRNDLASGAYDVTVIDNMTGCVQTVAFTLTDDVSEATIEITELLNISCIQSIGEVQYTVTYEPGFVLPAYITITDSLGMEYSDTLLPIGAYCINVMDENGCIAGQSCFDIIDQGNIELEILPAIVQEATCGNANGEVEIVVSGGSGDYSYGTTWGPNAYRSDLAAGIYFVDVIDNNTGCVGTVEFTLVETGMEPITIAELIPAGCNSNTGAATLFPSTYIYTWEDGVIGNMRTDLFPGVYTVTATDGSCSDLITLVIDEVNSLEVVPEIEVQPSCDAFNGVVNLIVIGGSGDYSYDSTWGTSSIRTDLGAGSYQVVVMDNQTGCSNVVVFELSSTSAPVATIVSTSPSTCGLNNGTAVLSPSIYVYTWQDGGTGGTRTDLLPGAYDVTVTDTDSLCSTLLTVIIDEDFNSLIVDAIIVNEPGCGNADGEVEIVVSGGSGDYTYGTNWGPNAMRNDLSAGTYFVDVTDNVTGCVGTVTFILIDNLSAAFIDITDIINPTCNNANGEVIYDIVYEPGFVEPASAAILDAAGNVYLNGNLPPGQYCIIVTDANGCIAGESCFDIIEEEAINVEVNSIGNVTCDTLGSIYLSVSGGLAPYTFDWMDLAGANDPEDREELEVGIYTVTVTDANGCTVVLNGLLVNDDCQSSGEITFVNPPLDTIAECDNIPTTFLPSATTTCPVAGVEVTMDESVSTTGCEYDIIRTFTAVDDCGNVATAIQVITVIDITVPELIDVPADITVECNEVPDPPTDLFGVDNCTTNVIVTMEEVEEGVSCEPGNLIIRTWTATDDCGNTSSQSQIITVVNTATDLTMTNVPLDTLISCGDFIDVIDPTVTTTCSISDINLVMDEETIEGSCEGSYTLVRTWTATDACGNVATAAQSIEVYDNIAPEIILVEDFVVDLINGDSMPAEFISAVDACDSDLDYIVDGTEMQTDDGYNLIRNYTVIDDCGNESYATQSIDIIGGVVWPGDADSNKVVNFMDIFNIGFGFGATGTPRDNPTLDWFPQYTAPWAGEIPLSEVNFRHADTDGNGIIDIYDVQAVSENWGMTHNFRGEDNGDTRNLYEVDFELDTILPNGWVYIDVMLGEENDPIDDFYGVGFVVEYDKNIVKESSAHLDFDESWGGVFFDDMIAIQKDFYDQGNIQTGLVRTDQEGISGHGKIASFRFQLKDGAELPGDFTLTTHSGEGVVENGERYEVEEAEISVTKSKTVINDYQFKVYPNPAIDVLHLDVDPTLSLDKIELYNAAGVLVLTESNLSASSEISVTDLGVGIYMLRLTIEGENVYRKVSIMR